MQRSCCVFVDNEDELKKTVKFDLSGGNENVKLVNRNFISILKTTNDVSLENVLEVKPLLGPNSNSAKIKNSDCEIITQSLDYSETIQKFLENLNKTTNDSGSGSMNEEDQSIEANNNNDLLYKRPKIDQSEMFSSTPIKSKEGYKLNLLTPPLDATFIDSDCDFESMEQDQYDTCSSKESLKIQQESKSDDKIVKNKTRKQSTFDFIEETLLKTPLAIRKKFQRRRNSEQPTKNQSFLNIFGSSRKKSVHVTIDEHRTIRKSLNCDYSPESSRSTSPDSFSKQDLKRLENTVKEVDRSSKTLIWCENFDYSYECEPSNSDMEHENCTELENHLPSPDCSFELKSPLIPTFRLQGPDVACDIVTQIITSSFAVKTSPASFLKRSSSDPMNINKSTRGCRRSLELMTKKSISESIEENENFSSAFMEHNLIQQASIRSLDQMEMSVS